KSNLPTVEGAFGSEPTINFPLKKGMSSPTPSDSAAAEAASPSAAAPEPSDTASAALAGASTSPSPSSTASVSPFLTAPTKLQAEVLSAGSGAAVKTGNVVVVNYKGVKWGETDAFDDSFTRGQTAAMTLSSSALLSGWVRGLNGKKLGSRVLLVIPPTDGGYGLEGNSSGSISGTDTIVFVIDLIAQYPYAQQAQTDAAPQPAMSELAAPSIDADGNQSSIKVTGALGKEPTISIPNGLTAPKQVTTTILAKGTGEAVAEGDDVLVQFKAVDWDGKAAGDTWTGVNLNGIKGLQAESITASDASDSTKITPFSQLIGVPIGSRVLIELPGDSDAYAAIAAVVDIVAKVPQASTSPSASAAVSAEATATASATATTKAKKTASASSTK
ncbi:MAG: FKBP-type peptidyl-prolyl cis-trans isomerase, partial [Bifidobacteriaceae bacterium]|nr:FKBP-type peptidyl-prolyl cis-trans isomerase [Bifidobacteriaceae bacterium]